MKKFETKLGDQAHQAREIVSQYAITEMYEKIFVAETLLVKSCKILKCSTVPPKRMDKVNPFQKRSPLLRALQIYFQ